MTVELYPSHDDNAGQSGSDDFLMETARETVETCKSMASFEAACVILTNISMVFLRYEQGTLIYRQVVDEVRQYFQQRNTPLDINIYSHCQLSEKTVGTEIDAVCNGGVGVKNEKPKE